MRLWTIHPKYLDTKGLVALWREGLGALASLNPTKGYHNHPQLNRFKKSGHSYAYLRNYMYFVYEEAVSRGYNFNLDKIGYIPFIDKPLEVDRSQVAFEIGHLYGKLKERSVPNFNMKLLPDNALLNPVFKLKEI